MGARTIGLVLGASAIVARQNSPDPTHPRIRRWYKRIDKPGFTPPDPVFGAVWPVLENGLAFGGYRLRRQPSSLPRNAAVSLWLVTTAMVGGWTQLFFGEKRLAASVVASGAMLVTGGLCRRRRPCRSSGSRCSGAIRGLAGLRYAACRACAAAEPAAGARDDMTRLTVWHDGGCPLCRREIALMRRLDWRRAIEFVDASRGDVCPADRAALLARFHAREDGRMLVGAAAFAAMWRAIPLLRPLGLAARNRFVLAALEAAYGIFLHTRPKLQRLSRRLERAAA